MIWHHILSFPLWKKRVEFLSVFAYGSAQIQMRKWWIFVILFPRRNICINWFCGFEWISIHSVFFVLHSFITTYEQTSKINREVANEWPCHQNGLRETSNATRLLWLERIGCEFNYSDKVQNSLVHVVYPYVYNNCVVSFNVMALTYRSFYRFFLQQKKNMICL